MADETRNETSEETVDEEAPDTPEEPSAEAEALTEAEAEPAAEETPVEEPAAEAPAAEEAADAPAAEAAPVEDEAADGAVPVPEAPPPPAVEVKRKRKRVPRPLRRQRTKPARETTGGRKALTRLPKPESERGRRQERRGVVVSSQMDKTIVVRVDTVKAHPRYKKIIRRSAKFHAHDERNEAKVGDVVRIVETRPLSKTKRWRLAEIVEAAK